MNGRCCFGTKSFTSTALLLCMNALGLAVKLLLISVNNVELVDEMT